jgi:YggT family protein
VEFVTIFLRFLVLALYAVLLGRVLWSWIDPTFRGPVGRFLFETTEPVLAPIRRFLPQRGPLDWSPIVAFILLTIVAGVFGLR